MEFSCMDSMPIFLCMDAYFDGTVHMNFHAKSGVCSSKNGWVMSTFVLMYFFVLLYFFVRKWLRAVKIYLHAKFRASSSKIDRVMVNFVFCSAAPFRSSAPLRACDQPTCRAVRFAPAKNGKTPPPLSAYFILFFFWGGADDLDLFQYNTCITAHLCTCKCNWV